MILLASNILALRLDFRSWLCAEWKNTNKIKDNLNRKIYKSLMHHLSSRTIHCLYDLLKRYN